MIDSGNQIAVALLGNDVQNATDFLDARQPIRYHGPAGNLSGVWGVVGSNNSYPITMITGTGCGLGTLRGDADGDGEVAFLDFLVLANNFGNADAAFADGDFDCDGSVGFLDFLVLANHFGDVV